MPEFRREEVADEPFVQELAAPDEAQDDANNNLSWQYSAGVKEKE